MNGLKKTLSSLLVLVMMIGIICVAPFNVFAATNCYVSSAEEFISACDTADANGGEYNIYITKDFTVTGGVSFANPNVNVTFYGEGHTISFTGHYQGIQVWNGAVMNFGSANYSKTLTLKGDDSIQDNDNPGLLYITNLESKGVLGDYTPGSYNATKNSVCNMYDGVTVKNHKGNNYFGGGVSVEGGTFHMYGGTIDNCGIEDGSVCFGGGVAVYNGGAFEMNGGTISNCYALSDASSGYTISGVGGGVFVSNGSSFIMNNGTITNNESTSYGGGIALVLSEGEFFDCGGLGHLQSSVTINNGTISNNSSTIGAGITVTGQKYAKAAPICYYNYSEEGTPPANPGLHINGGSVENNTAADSGGGICINGVDPSKDISIKNALITGNKADNGYGGGVLIYAFWSKSTFDNCTISNNTANLGAGLCSLNNWDRGTTGTLLKDTSVIDNTASGFGGGVYYNANKNQNKVSAIHLLGENIIKGNTVDDHPNNMNIDSKEYPVYIDGDITGSQIGLSDPTLWDDNMEDTDENAVSTDYLTSGYKANNASLEPMDAFFSDHASWYVDRSQATTTTVTDPDSKTYREYTVKRYAYIPPDDPKMNALFGQKNQYVYSEIQNPDIENISSFTDLYNEMKYRYSDTSRFTKKNDVNSNGNIYLKYDILDADYPTTLTIQKSSNKSYASVTFSQSPLTGKGGTIEFDVYLSDQTNYANPKEMVYKINSSATAPADYYAFSDEYTTKTVKYVNTNPPADTIYEYDEYGNLTAKLEIVGGVSSYETKQSTTTTTTGTDNEVRLVRKVYDVNYHINNDDMDDIYADEIFTPYVTNHEVKDGNEILEFHNIPQLKDPDGYVFKGWYYDRDNNDDSNPIEFGSAYEVKDKYVKGVDIYAHWEPVAKIEQEKDIDEKELPSDMQGDGGKYYYDSFGLFGVQLRPDQWRDENTGAKENGGLRFATSIGEQLLRDVDALSDKKVVSEQGYEHNVEYGFVTASKATTDKVVNDPTFNIDKAAYKLQYKGTDVNGVDTTVRERSANNFNYVTNVDCTSQKGGYGGNDAIQIDHRDCSAYRIATFVVTYEDHPENLGKDVIARAYMRYYDANGLLRTFYNDYGGTTVYGGCCTNYNAAAGMLTGDPIEDNKQITN